MCVGTGWCLTLGSNVTEKDVEVLENNNLYLT